MGLGARARAYGPVRLWGSVAFIVANVGAGTLLGVIDPVHLIWLIVAALVIATLAAINLQTRSMLRSLRRTSRRHRRGNCGAIRPSSRLPRRRA